MKDNNTPKSLKTRALRVFFYLLYHQLAWMYDFVAGMVSLGMWKDWIASVLPLLQGPRVLELGYGPGHLQAMMQTKHIKTFGIDNSRQMGRIATRRIHSLSRTSNLINAYAQILPFPNCSFEQIVATFPTEYAFDPRTLAESLRVLVPGGTMIVLPHAWITGNHFREQAAACLFRITGQAPEWHESFLIPFKDAGFQPRKTEIRHHSWSTLAIIAEKHL